MRPAEFMQRRLEETLKSRTKPFTTPVVTVPLGSLSEGIFYASTLNCGQFRKPDHCRDCSLGCG